MLELTSTTGRTAELTLAKQRSRPQATFPFSQTAFQVSRHKISAFHFVSSEEVQLSRVSRFLVCDDEAAISPFRTYKAMCIWSHKE